MVSAVEQSEFCRGDKWRGMGDGRMTDDAGQHPFDLMERTAQFGEAIIDFAKQIPFTQVTKRLIEQLVGAGTSIGANYCEADSAVSNKDFRHRIAI